MVLPEGLPSWLVLVLFLLFGTPALFSQYASKLPSVLGAAGRWWQKRKQPGILKKAEQAASYRLQEAEISRLSKQYYRLSEDWAEQSLRIDRLEDKLTETNRRFFVLVRFSQNLISDIRKIDPNHVIREIPELLKDYL